MFVFACLFVLCFLPGARGTQESSPSQNMYCMATKELSRLAALAAAEVVAALGTPAEPEVRGTAYVRAECLGRGSAAAWTQPFWLAQ